MLVLDQSVCWPKTVAFRSRESILYATLFAIPSPTRNRLCYQPTGVIEANKLPSSSVPAIDGCEEPTALSGLLEPNRIFLLSETR
jgi:hypothetical protein